MANTTAVGADALLSFVIDAPSSVTNIGHPGLDNTPVADPVAAPTYTAGTTGTITGTPLYKFSWVVAGFETGPSPASTGTALSAKKAELDDVANCPDDRCTEKKIYRSEDGGTSYAWIGSIYDNVTETFSDNLAFGSALIDTKKKPRAASQIGNWYLKFAEPDSFQAEANYAEIQTNQLSGNSARGRSTPGLVTVPVQVVGALKAGLAIPMFSALYGKPTVAAVTSTPLTKYTFNSSTAKTDPRSLTALAYKGGTIPPEFLYGLVGTQMQMNIAGNALAMDTFTLAGNHHSVCGVGTEETGGSTYNGCLVSRGVRQDSGYASDFFVKITVGPTAGTFKVKMKVGALSAYGSTQYTVYYDVSTKKQIKGGTQVSEWFDAYDENDLPLGADSCENRLPFQLMFTGDVTGLALNDEFKVATSALIPGGTGTGYTGVPLHKLIGCRFGAANVTLKKNGSYLDCQGAQLTFAAPKAPINSLGPEARTASDFVDSGFYTGTAQITRRYNSREFEKALQKNDRVSLEILLEGGRIHLTPGTPSTNREYVKITFNQMAVSNTQSNVAGPSFINETINLTAEQPDDTDLNFCDVEIVSSENWQYLA